MTALPTAQCSISSCTGTSGELAEDVQNIEAGTKDIHAAHQG
jgi:hypothetical protein